MTNRNAAYGYGELTDGTTWDGVRVPLASKIALERAARANAWDMDRNTFTVAAFLSWHAARAAGMVPADLSWDDFLAAAVDAGISEDAPDAAPDAGADELDPTR